MQRKRLKPGFFCYWEAKIVSNWQEIWVFVTEFIPISNRAGGLAKVVTAQGRCEIRTDHQPILAVIADGWALALGLPPREGFVTIDLHYQK